MGLFFRKGERGQVFHAPRLKRFHIRELQKSCPEVSLARIRKVLAEMRANGKVECTGRGKLARWRLIEQ